MVARRRFTAEFKAQVVLEVISGMKTAAEACREYRLKPQVREMLQRGEAPPPEFTRPEVAEILVKAVQEKGRVED